MKILIFILMFFSAPVWALKFTQFQIVTAGDMSTASILSPGTELRDVPLASIHAIWTGSPVGTLIVQISGDMVADQSLVTNWSDFSGSSIAINGASDVMYNMPNAGYRWARLKYTKTSGTGTLNAILSAKGQY
jgi:hypothetical protein